MRIRAACCVAAFALVGGGSAQKETLTHACGGYLLDGSTLHCDFTPGPAVEILKIQVRGYAPNAFCYSTDVRAGASVYANTPGKSCLTFSSPYRYFNVPNSEYRAIYNHPTGGVPPGADISVSVRNENGYCDSHLYIEIQYQELSLLEGQQHAARATKACNDGAEPAHEQCYTDDDCTEAEWCKPLIDESDPGRCLAEKRCAPRAQMKGMSCRQGGIALCGRQLCAAEMKCASIESDPTGLSGGRCAPFVSQQCTPGLPGCADYNEACVGCAASGGDGQCAARARMHKPCSDAAGPCGLPLCQLDLTCHKHKDHPEAAGLCYDSTFDDAPCLPHAKHTGCPHGKVCRALANSKYGVCTGKEVEQTICSAADGVGPCVTLDLQLTRFLHRCTNGDGGESQRGKVKVNFKQVKVTLEEGFAQKLVTGVCAAEGGVLTIKAQAAATADKPIRLTGYAGGDLNGKTDLTLVLSRQDDGAVKLDWHGTAFSAAAPGGYLPATVAVAKGSPTALVETRVVTSAAPAAHDPALPQAMTYRARGAILWTAATPTGAMCRLDAAVGAGGWAMTVPGVDATVTLAAGSTGVLHACRFWNPLAPGLLLEFQGTMKRGVSLEGVAVPALDLGVKATRGAGGVAVVSGSYGAATASTEVLGAPATLTLKGHFADGVLTSRTMHTVVETDGMTLVADVSYTGEPCNPANRGAGVLTLPYDEDFVLDVSMAQLAGCGADGVTPNWRVSGAARPGHYLSVGGVEVAECKVDLTSNLVQRGADAPHTHVWHGQLMGKLRIAEGELGGSDIWARVDFNEKDVTGFGVGGTLVAGPVTVAGAGTVKDGVLRIDGSVQVALGNGFVPEVKASVQHVLTYNTINSKLPEWRVVGNVAKVPIHGFELKNVSVLLEGMPVGTEGATVWRGYVEGSASIAGATARLRAEVQDEKFQALEGNLSLAAPGFDFYGGVRIAPDRAENDGCVNVTAEGGRLAVHRGARNDLVFLASVLVNPCAPAGTPRFHLEASANTSLELVGGAYPLVLSRVSAEMTGNATQPVAVGDPRGVSLSGLAWEGRVSGTANLFGGSSSATVAFREGALQEVNVSSRFAAANGIISGQMSFSYLRTEGASCATFAGAGGVTLRLDGAGVLVVNGRVTYAECTGVVTIDGALKEGGTWTPPAIGGASKSAAHAVTVSLRSSGHGGDVGKKLAAQTWTGKISFETAFGLGMSLAFDSSKNKPSVVGTVSYRNEYIEAEASLYTACRGAGLVILKGLPHDLPSVEVEMAFEKFCEEETGAGWKASGRVADLRIPFGDRTLRLPTVEVTVVARENSPKHVRIRGELFGTLAMELAFDVPFRKESLAFYGSMLQPMNGEDFMKMLHGGQTPFEGSLSAGAPALSQSLRSMELTAAFVNVTLAPMSLQFAAQGSAFDVGFDVIGGVRRNQLGRWEYGLGFTLKNEGFELPDTVPAPVRTALAQLTPSWLRFGLSSARMEIHGHVLQQGLSVTVCMGTKDLGFVRSFTRDLPKDVKDAVMGELMSTTSCVAAAAVIKSVDELHLMLMLTGRFDLGTPAVQLRELGVAFIMTPPTGVEVALHATVDATFGEGDDAQTFTAGGYLRVSPVSVGASFSISSDRPWQPFAGLGVTEVAVLFPVGLGFEVAITPLGPAPSQLAIMGGVMVCGVKGYVVVGVDLLNARKTGAMATIENTNLKRVVSGVASCPDCAGGVGRVAGAIRLAKVGASFNVDPVNALTVHAGAESVVIPAGISLEVEGLSLWDGWIYVHRAHLSVSKNGVEAGLEMEPLHWGPISVTAADGVKGPRFALALTKTKQYLLIGGRITIFGQWVALKLEMSNAGTTAHFRIKILWWYIDISVNSLFGIPLPRMSGDLDGGAVNSLNEHVQGRLAKGTGRGASALAAPTTTCHVTHLAFDGDLAENDDAPLSWRATLCCGGELVTKAFEAPITDDAVLSALEDILGHALPPMEDAPAQCSNNGDLLSH